MTLKQSNSGNPWKKFDKAFLTGCDKATEWMLPWFIHHFKSHVNLPLVFADFGLTKQPREFIGKHAACIIEMQDMPEKGWFKKPKAMLACPSIKTVWIDTDCQITTNIDQIFDRIVAKKLLMGEDIPWSKRRNDKWHNSGVVGFVDKPYILNQWADEVMKNPQVGDQEVLHSMLNPITRIGAIEDLPNEYNVLRIQMEEDGPYKGKTKIIHWTGRKGKERIKGMIKDG